MYETNFKKISKEYNKYVIVIIGALIMMSFSICVILNIKAISDNTTNYVKVDKFEKTREDFILGTYKYKTKHYYKINGNEYVCEKTLIAKYRNPSKNEEVCAGWHWLARNHGLPGADGEGVRRLRRAAGCVRPQ